MRSQPARTEPTAVTYVGHASVLIELAGTRLLTDPILGAGFLHVRRRVPAPSVEALEPLDAVLISHAHHDHLDHWSLRRVAGAHPVVVARGGAGAVRRGGARRVVELAEGQRAQIGAVGIEAVHAAHNGRRYPLSRPMAAVGFVLHGPRTIYFAGDTDLFPGMYDLAGHIDVALLPIWGWGPRVPAGHLDPIRAAEAVARIQPHVAVPIHWGTLRAWGAQRGLDPRAPALAFVDEAQRRAPETQVRVLSPGERTTL